MKNQFFLELAYFELKQGVNESSFLEVSKTFKKDFLEKQEGYIDRKLVKSVDGKWCVVAFWNNEESASLVLENMKSDKISQEYLSFMDFNSVKIEHFFMVQD